MKNNIEKVLELKQNGKTYSEMALFLGYSKARVWRILKKNNATLPFEGRIKVEKLVSKRIKKSLEERNEHTKNYIKNWRKDNRKKLVEYKGGKCERCKYDKCEQALDFHHIDPSIKEFGLCNTTKSFDKLKTEADKCVLLCSNCHREWHFINRKNKHILITEFVKNG